MGMQGLLGEQGHLPEALRVQEEEPEMLRARARSGQQVEELLPDRPEARLSAQSGLGELPEQLGELPEPWELPEEQQAQVEVQVGKKFLTRVKSLAEQQ